MSDEILLCFSVIVIVIIVVITILPKILYGATHQYDEKTSSSSLASYDVIVVGAGIGGCVAAITLARQGRHVLLLERDMRMPKRIVGELLQPSGVECIRDLGLSTCLEGIDAQKVNGYSVHQHGKNVYLPYPAEAVFGMSFVHGKFVQKLRDTAKAELNICFQQALVTKLDMLTTDITTVRGVFWRDDNKVTHRTTAYLTVVCDGCMSTLRKQCGSEVVSKTTRSRFVGLEVRRPDCVEAERAHVIMAQPTPVLCYPISSTTSRVLVDVPLGANITKHVRSESLMSQLPDFLRESFRECVATNGVLPSMPSQSLNDDPLQVPPIGGLVRLGDALNMRHPLTGAGMSIAIRDCRDLQANLSTVSSFADKSALNDAVTSFYSTRRARSMTMNTLADALYEVVISEGLSAVFFTYVSVFDCALSLGPMQLLAGVSSNQYKLLLHFFSVAVFGGIREIIFHSSWKSFSKALQFIREAIGMIAPILQRHGANIFLRSLVELSAFAFWVDTSKSAVKI